MTPSTQLSSELKPCPFCGKVPARVKQVGIHKMNVVRCETMGCALVGTHFGFGAWNRRVLPSVARDEVAEAMLDEIDAFRQMEMIGSANGSNWEAGARKACDALEGYIRRVLKSKEVK